MNYLILLALLVSCPVFAEENSVGEPIEEMVTTEELAPAEPALPEASSIETDAPVITTDEFVEPQTPVSSETTAAEDRRQLDLATTPVISTRTPEDDRKLNHYKSHWLTSFGFEGLKYETNYNFTGKRKRFRPSTQELWGGRIGLGYQLHLGKGFFATTKVDGYFVGTLFTRSLTAAPQEATEEAAFIKRTGQVFGADITQSLGYIFEMKTKNPFMDEWAYLTVEPYIEAGIGRASAYNRLNYHWDTGAGNTQEDYRARIKDELTNVRYGGGFNFTANSGFFLYLKGTVNNFNVTERSVQEFVKQDGVSGATSKTTPKNVTLDPVIIYALGGGYKF